MLNEDGPPRAGKSGRRGAGDLARSPASSSSMSRCRQIDERFHDPAGSGLASLSRRRALQPRSGPCFFGTHLAACFSVSGEEHDPCASLAAEGLSCPACISDQADKLPRLANGMMLQNGDASIIGCNWLLGPSLGLFIAMPLISRRPQLGKYCRIRHFHPLIIGTSSLPILRCCPFSSLRR